MILGIDTISDWSSVAVGDKSSSWSGNRNQSMDLLPQIEKILNENKVAYNNLKGVAVVNGPGSYTGIRIGVSVANTIGMIEKIPVRGIDALYAQLVAWLDDERWEKIKKSNGKLMSLLSAGRDRVYVKNYLVGQTIKAEGEFVIDQIEMVLKGENKDLMLIGEVNEEVENFIKSSGFEHLEMLNGRDQKGRAWGAVKCWDELPAVANDNVIPLYLREAVRK